jgi:hypothetical protein
MYSARRELPFESLRIFDGVERSILIKRASEAIPSFDIRHLSAGGGFDILRFDTAELVAGCGSLLNFV